MPRRRDDYDDYDDGYGGGLEPHRGTLILILGVLSLMACQLIGPFAWAMGGADLKKMRAGVMDPAGENETRIGYILGIVGTVLLLISFALRVVWFAFFFRVVGAGVAAGAKG